MGINYNRVNTSSFRSRRQKTERALFPNPYAYRHLVGEKLDTPFGVGTLVHISGSCLEFEYDGRQNAKFLKTTIEDMNDNKDT